ncbi:hypothetical protein B0J14DRAFT_644518 [Halenospora varia]|nr:hypothetical protein B0J14DRAFT_644518 [Halenospora varia]
MATLENIPGLKTEVFVDNKPLEEFDDDEDEPELSVDSDNERRKVYIDGEHGTSPILEVKAEFTAFYCLVRLGKVIVKGIKLAQPGLDGRAFLKNPKSAKTATTPDDAKVKDIKADSKLVDQVGEIKIEVFRGGESRHCERALLPLDHPLKRSTFMKGH